MLRADNNHYQFRRRDRGGTITPLIKDCPTKVIYEGGEAAQLTSQERGNSGLDQSRFWMIREGWLSPQTQGSSRISRPGTLACANSHCVNWRYVS